MESSAPPSAASSSSRFTSHGGEKPSCVVGRVLDVRPAHVLVGVEHVDEARARRVGLLGCGANKRLMLDERVDPEDLAGLQVHADVHRQARVLAQSLVGGHPGSLLREVRPLGRLRERGSPTLTCRCAA